MLVESAYNFYNAIKLHFDEKGTYDCFKYNFSLRRTLNPETEKRLKLYQSVAARASTCTRTKTDEVLYFFATFRKNPKAFITEFSRVAAADAFKEYRFMMENRLPELYRDFLRSVCRRLDGRTLKDYYMTSDGNTSMMFEDIVTEEAPPEIFVIHNKIFGCVEKTDDEMLVIEYNKFPRKFEGVVDVDGREIINVYRETISEFRK